MNEGLLDRIWNGDCLNVMDVIEDNSVDLIVTDPPYGLSFMGRDWDKAVPHTDIWKQCLRVLNPGAFAFIMCTPRQDCLSRMIVNLQDAGFETGFTSILWTYANGFPKAMNISKMIMKQVNDKGEIIGRYRLPNGKEWNLKQSDNPDIEHSGGNFTSSKTRTLDIIEPVNPQAKALNGSYAGFQPKPAVEVIIVVMKPLSEKTYVEQALKNGHGVTWLDNCRVPINEKIRTPQSNPNNRKGIVGTDLGITKSSIGKFQQSQQESIERLNSLGRFPANLLVSDDALNNGVITVSSGGQSNNQFRQEHNIYGDEIENKQKVNPGLGDFGSFSRYFDLDKWWESKVKELPESVQKTYPFLICPKASKSERNGGISDLEKGNIHPTVKPIKLISYLVTLGSRKNNIVIDPFIGSGTTAIACKMTNRHFIGIELSQEYCNIAEQRIKAYENSLKDNQHEI